MNISGYLLMLEDYKQNTAMHFQAFHLRGKKLGYLTYKKKICASCKKQIK
jgi:hypothetical protein